MRDQDFIEISDQMSRALGVKCAARPARAVTGGSINSCFEWPADREALFVKVAHRERRDMLEAEAEGLRELAAANAVRVPKVRACGATSRFAYLALEWIESGAYPSAQCQSRLGEQLASQHRWTAQRFGWHRDNTIGLTEQQNAWADDWVTFYRERRLRFQLDLATSNGYGSLVASPGERLLERLEVFFTDYRPVPSLLHGDLWGGNWLAAADDSPVIFDPAVYYGDREADIAMTYLFGGFDRAFYDAYEASWPLDTGHRVRRDLYNLYHVLNHANLFGGAYARQGREMIDRLLAQAGR